MFIIKKNTERYGDILRQLPDQIQVDGVTEEQAEFIAECLTNYVSGCDWAFYVVGGKADRER